MALTIISTSTTTAGLNTLLTVAGDDFHLLAGDLLASTTAEAIRLSAADIAVGIDGAVSAGCTAMRCLLPS